MRLQRPVAVVTGTTHGIGRVCARELVHAGFELHMLVRDVQAGGHLAEALRAVRADALVHVVACELGSLASVRQAADQVLQRSPRLRLLLNNAGMVSLRRERSMDGFERVFAVNHLGPFLLTERLRAALESGGRIVNVASSDHARGQLQLQAVLDPDAHPWRPRAAYARSKLANVLHAFALARRLQGSGVSAHALHPGVVHTQLLPRWLRAIKPLMSPGMLSAEQGARSSLHLALTPDVSALNGGYLDADQQPRAASRAAQDRGLQEALWAASWAWCGLSGGSG